MNNVIKMWAQFKRYSSFGSDNDLVSIRQQSVIWTNDEYFSDAYYSVGLYELKTFQNS